jgi:hypothetical protein
MAISYNDPITLGRHGTAKDISSTGVDFSEDGTRSWTISSVAELDIRLPFARGRLLELEATPFMAPEMVLSQKVFIFMGGLFVGYWSLVGHSIKEFHIARDAISNRTARLSLVLPNATSPESQTCKSLESTCPR